MTGVPGTQPCSAQVVVSCPTVAVDSHSLCLQPAEIRSTRALQTEECGYLMPKVCYEYQALDDWTAQQSSETLRQGIALRVMSMAMMKMMRQQPGRLDPILVEMSGARNERPPCASH
jgi:hypothetical protein